MMPLSWINFGLAFTALIVGMYALVTALYNKRHVNQWLVDIPAFYKDFPDQMKTEIRKEWQPFFDLILQDLQYIKRREFVREKAKATAESPMGMMKLTAEASQMIAGGDLAGAIENLSIAINDKQIQDDLTLLRYRLSRAQADDRAGKDTSIERTKIAEALLVMAREIG